MQVCNTSMNKCTGISYKDHITNTIGCIQIQAAIGPYEETLTTVKKGNYEGSDRFGRPSPGDMCSVP